MREKMADVGSRGVWRVICIVNIIQVLAEKLRKIILLHFGLLTFRIHFRENRKLIIVMFSGLGGRVHEPRNQYYLSLETRRILK